MGVRVVKELRRNMEAVPDLRIIFSRTKLACLLLSLFSVVSPQNVTGQNTRALSDWKTQKTSDDIKISYRQVMVADTFKTRVMRIQFGVEATPQELLPFFKDAELFVRWSTDMDECTVLHDSPDAWTLYKFYNMPWPIAERDIITHYEIEESAGSIRLDITAKPELTPERDKVQRIKQYQGFWEFVLNDQGGTSVEFQTVEWTKPIAPRFVQDPVVQKSFINSIKQLQIMVKQ